MREILGRLKPYAGLLKWLFALGLLGYLFYRNIYQNPEVLGRIAGRGVRAVDGSLALALCAASVLLTFVRWYLLVWAQDFDFRLRDAFRLGFLGLLFNYATPMGLVGGDLYKAGKIALEQQSRRVVAAATVVIDRVLGLLALFMVGATASLFLPYLRTNAVLASIAGLLWTGAAVGTLGMLVMMHPATPRSRWLNRLVHLKLVGRFIGELIQAVVLYQSKRKIVVLAVAISIFGHLGMLSCFYFSARALRLEAAPDYPTHLMIVPAAEVGASLAPVPGGVGVLEGAMSYFYGVDAARRAGQLAFDRTGLPPQWREALRAYSANESLWRQPPMRNEPPERRRDAAAVAADVARRSDDDGARFFAEGLPPVSPDAARAMYRAGHQELAKAGGLLATLLFRLINLLVAAIGFVCCMASRNGKQPTCHKADSTAERER